MRSCILLLILFTVFESSAEYLPTEGHGINIVIDSLTPLGDLIKRLDGDWKFIQTNKGYWIGYTVDMFSIAAKKDAAIQPLIDVAERSTNMHARIGALYTLHLIGINSKIVGRDYELFTNEKARRALLYLLRYDDLQKDIIVLLTRDPNLIDVPEVFKAMERSVSDCWALNNYLTQFPISAPLCQNIPLKFEEYVPLTQHEVQQTVYAGGDRRQATILKRICDAHFKRVIIDTLPFNFNLRLPTQREIIDFYTSTVRYRYSLRHLLYDETNVSFLQIGSILQYYLEGDKIHICTQYTAKQRLLKFWHEMPKSRKVRFCKFKRIGGYNCFGNVRNIQS